MPDKADLLLQLLHEDGVVLTGRGKNQMALCPFHEERTPSFSVNVEKGVYFCHGCEAKGDAITYLEMARGLSKAQSLKRAGVSEGNAGFQRVSKRRKEPKPPLWVARIPPAEAVYPYRDAEGNEVFTITRPPPRTDGKKGAKVLPWTPAPNPKTGAPGWLCVLEMDAKRPLYRLPELLASPLERQVWIPEGEKCADALVGAYGKGVAVTTWSGGSRSIGRTDFGPLRDRRVLLLADADTDGRKAMRALATALAGHCASVKVWMPEGEDGRDIYDYLRDLGPKGALERLRAESKVFEAPAAPVNLEEVEGVRQISPVLEGPHFRVLGTAEPGRVVIQVASKEILHFGRSAVTQPSTLIAIGDMEWWLSIAQSKTLTRDMCHTLGNVIIREAERLGRLDMGKIVGRGAHREDEKVVWHLGDRLLDGEAEVPLRNTETSIYTEGARVQLLPRKKCAGEADRHALADAVLRYRWATTDDGRRFLGWLVSSVVGGALPWRPHCWMIAPASTGKSWILENVVMRLMGHLCARLADTTPAGISRRMASDSLPVLLEEAEPDRAWIQELLSITRLAAGGDGERVRASGETGVSIMNPRFSAMVASTKLVRLREADASRFAIIQLAHDPVPDWVDVRDGIIAALAGEKARSLRSAIIRSTAEITAAARAAAVQFAKEGDTTRESLIRGALTSGWQWISGDASPVRRATPQSEERAIDAVDALREILSLLLRSTTGQDRPIADMLFSTLPNHDDVMAIKSLGISYDVHEGLSIALKHPYMESRLLHSRLAKVDLEQLLSQIPAAWIPDDRFRFGSMRSRRVVIPPEQCEAAGFDTEAAGNAPAEDTGVEDPAPELMR